MNINFSMVPTGPPQQAKHGLSMPGAFSPIWSSIAFFAFSFMASMAAAAMCGEAATLKRVQSCCLSLEPKWLE
eukprot:CAMPEP_0204526980 /NCGR_PEP_ID=MMETSP0661-20131031/8725_1 /ASSEMBLY_ACC=CAM_ASM_000606 /TAXON_ID=109239 /ORGANISM="Alexandrium margalefi, Strain AMGDE01CS-322" /LENGTH=72 /DNA_ID=CAMNT_0051532847 /DNA_START=376 /DNA_END=591 /DNA_ORIENTATION=+